MITGKYNRKQFCFTKTGKCVRFSIYTRQLKIRSTGANGQCFMIIGKSTYKKTGAQY